MTPELISKPSMGVLIGILAENHPDRVTLQLMMELKGLLQDVGISISLSTPDVYTQLLKFSRGIQDTAVQHARQGLKKVEPPHACVYGFDQENGQLSCGRCRYILTLRIPDHASKTRPIRIACPNCHMPFAVART